MKHKNIKPTTNNKHIDSVVLMPIEMSVRMNHTFAYQYTEVACYDCSILRVRRLDYNPNSMVDNVQYVAVQLVQFVDYLAVVEIGLVLVAVHTFHSELVDSMCPTVLHTVDRNWDKLLVDNMFGTVANSTYLEDVDCMERNNLLADMLDNAFDA